MAKINEVETRLDKIEALLKEMADPALKEEERIERTAVIKDALNEAKASVKEAGTERTELLDKLYKITLNASFKDDTRTVSADGHGEVDIAGIANAIANRANQEK